MPANELPHNAKDIHVLAPKRPESNSEVRSIFISDIHLGSRYARAEPLLQFLRRYSPDHLFLVGDFIDGWSLARKWHWPPIYNILIRHLLVMVEHGTQIFYTPGNHDDFLRKFYFDQSLVQIHDEFIHECADGRRLVVLHGDQFDDVEQSNRWLSKIGSIGYDGMLFFDRKLNDNLARISDRRLPISRFVKQSVKKVVQHVSGFEGKVVAHAKLRDCDGAICGHIHVPKHTRLGDITYVNLGDWLENCTALVEYADGSLELLDLEAELLSRDVLRNARSIARDSAAMQPAGTAKGQLAETTPWPIFVRQNDKRGRVPAGEKEPLLATRLAKPNPDFA
jgi:UDP-2,3-diacylglucosamine pyrophosphatase LpxH